MRLVGALLVSAFLWTVAALAVRGAVGVLRSGRYVHPTGLELTGLGLRLYAGALIALAVVGVGLSVFLIKQALQ